MRFFACALLVASACSTGDVDLTGKLCPCAEGWYCDRPTRRCLRGVEPLADAGRPDGGGSDAGTRDAGPDTGAEADAGARDAGPRDAGTDAGPPDTTTCDDTHAGAIFCDGFESGPGFPAWDETYGDGTIERSVARTFLGTGSMFAESTTGGGRAIAQKRLATAVTSGDVYLRAWAYVPSDFTVDGGFSILQAGQISSPYYHVSISVSRTGRSEIFINAEGGARTVMGDLVPRDEWVCFEAHVRLSDTDGLAELFMNTAPQGSAITSIDTLPAPGYEHIQAGIAYTDDLQTTARAYLDEVVFDDARIGCE